MRIKRVEIIGFKSFCDRAVLQIGESITGVVGPNGCGKSNIVDAIRWCMGEQSAKHLRGKAMEDVIFAGSESRGPAPMAEVSLTFDDVGFSAETLEQARHSDEAEAERALAQLEPDELAGEGNPLAPPATQPQPATQPTIEEMAQAATDAEPAAGRWTDAEGNPVASPLEEAQEVLADRPPAINFGQFTEVTITRRLYRDGTSQYFINKTPCRLRDITDFFLGTGVGTKAYAIIEQGRIGQIVSSRPQDRRAIIEEAAGITKFKAKKKAAEKKLDQTRQNLMRVSDIVIELDKRMGTLRRQAQKAERYRKYKTEMRDIELWKSAHRWLELASEGQLVDLRLTSARAELDQARTAWSGKDAHVVAERGELASEERRLLGLQEHVHELDNRIRLGESKIGFERREAEELDGRIAGARTELDTIAAQRAAGTEELAQREAELAELIAEVEREASEVEAREATAGEARQMLANAQRDLDQARTEIAGRRTEIATANAQLDALIRRRDEASRRLERVVDETEQQSARIRDLEREAKKVDAALAQLRQTRLDLGGQSEHFTARRELLADESARGEAEVETLRTELQRRTSRLTSLREIQDRYEGFQRGTRAVMQRAEAILEGAQLTDGEIHGVVADVVRAPEQLEVAVEAALGDRLGGVLVSQPEVGLAAVGFLKQGGAGRSAFVPVRSGRHQASTSAMSAAGWGTIEVDDRSELLAAHAAIGGEGVLGRMSDLVAFADGYESVGKRLFGTTVVVDGLDRALALHKQGVSDRLVTLDGDVVEGDGVVAGGSRDAQGAGVLAQKREIRDLEEIVGTLEHELADAMARLVTAKTELKQVTLALEGLRTQAHEGEIAIMGHEKDDTRIRSDLERHRDRLNQLAVEQRELDERLASIGGDDDAIRERRAAAEARIAELEQAQRDHHDQVAIHQARLAELAQILTEAKIRAAQLGEKRAAAEASALRLAAMDADLVKRSAKLAAEIDDATGRATLLREGCDQLAAELSGLAEDRAASAVSLEDGRKLYDARLGALTEVELASRELRARADQLGREVGQLELRTGQIKMTRQNVEDQIAERYQLEIPAILHDYHLRPQVTQIEDDRLAELRELIERMGTDINLTAIEEFAEVNQRHEFLSAQKNDLERAVEQLQRAIDKINKTSRKLFKDTFHAVNTTFKEVFPRLFRGGQAALSITGGSGDDVDLLEAGVEIMAQPPGKKNSTVEQLSGGEKALTAVALVFSIFLIKPSPLCILDEVDAPLDEANVDRYNELVREMTDRSQFIVISHNKRTMEAADNLYGVTMQEPGVSKLVSVNLSKLGQKAAPAAAAETAA
ncbi:MAG TPA: chromosome segregation protein SMC [Kofleriaceae bacterium]